MKKNPGCLGYIVDGKLPTYVGNTSLTMIRIPVENKQDFMETKAVFLCFVAQFDENELNRWDNVALEPRCQLVLEQAMKTSLRLAEYEDILDTQTIYSLIVGNLRWQKDLNCWCENQSLRTFDQALWSYTSWDF